ncbi:hypothetical protein IH980_00560 [Patescibacteria group bacterium]|nr:hypothetical protein [Patescibacteria group bacterium]
MVKRIPGEIAEKLWEQAKHTGKAAKQAPQTVFQRMVGEKTDEEKKRDRDRDRDKEDTGVEDVASAGGSQQAQQPLSRTGLRRREIEVEKKAKRKKMQKILHKRLFAEAEKVRRRKEEEERLGQMQEEEEKQKKKRVQIQQLEQKEKEEVLTVKVAKRAKGAGEFGPKKPK